MSLLRVLFGTLVCMALISCGHAAEKEDITIKSAGMSRTVAWMGDLLRTTRIETAGKSVIESPGVEFMLELQYKGEWLWLSAKDFKMMGITSSENLRETKTTLTLQCIHDALPFFLYIDYYTHPEMMYIKKSIRIDPLKGADEMVLRRVVLEDFQLRSDFSPVSPVDRYSGNSDDSPKADLSDTKTRFKYDTSSNYTAYNAKSNIGLFFLTASLFGNEGCTARKRIIMSEDTYIPLSHGFESGQATIGAVAGGPEVLFKRFREFVWENYCVMRGKKNMVIYQAESSGKENLSQDKYLAEMRTITDQGHFTSFLFDNGWENNYPLTEDKDRFPQSLPWLAQQAKDMGISLAYSINPLGSRGQTTDTPGQTEKWNGLMKDHPEWFATYDAAENPAPNGSDILCFNTPYIDYVEEKLLRLVNECGASMLYSDGNDWNEFKCPPSGQYHMEKAQLNYEVPKRLSAMYEKLYKANPGLLICLSPGVGNVLSHVHRLKCIDQIEFWKGTDSGCLGGRQQRYNQMFIYPIPTMHSSTGGVDMSAPFPQLKYDILSALPGYSQTLRTNQLIQPGSELSVYLKKALAFRARFEPYFEVYQHILNFPDGKSVDGEGHIINGKGFIMLFNPSEQAQKVALPLDEPGLELKGTLKLSDWTELETSVDMGTAKVGDKIEVELAPVSAKIIGINLE